MRQSWRQEQSRSSLQVAETIIQQLGGRQFAAMVGAKAFVAGPSSVQFSIGSGAKDGINKVLIVLEPSDAYTVEFWLVTRHAALRVSRHEDVYCDVLQDVFEAATGFYCTLFAR